MKAKQLFFLEGLPSAGKTSVENKLSKTGFSVVPEICNQNEVKKHHNKKNQSFFLENDVLKVNLAENASGIVIIDRSPLSTVFFNLAKLESNFDLSAKVLKWYLENFHSKFSTNSKYGFILMDVSPEASLARKGESVNLDDPWRSPEALKLIRQLYLYNTPRLLKSFRIVNAERNFVEVFGEVRQIINEYV